ncbi:MAG TPA: cysteine desulfurase family protein [Planctomycetota bacterium]|jgi:cysteine desulfurase|nr:cysteine desulfurase [Planctomycetota bacterium]OQC22360.1 MAG: Cysteine desulfurase [Planctomycetes bacterium ADurb.Bin069]HNR98824.1 cysteine desulfurase family protein [Planctomycetota bacterium]HNU26600.1 cysteine desulfurase family protein [Planctomycetota bacterium]HOE29190.1 cysteine desulfurase family protein [Planctomycetota bacterium]
MPAGAIYLDHNATTPPDPRVMEAVGRALAVAWGNPSSVHAPGLAARETLQSARDEAARLVGVDSSEVVFTSGGTEAIALAVASAWRRREAGRRRVVVSAVEHPAVLEAARGLASEGAEVVVCPVDGEGRVDLEALRARVDETTALVAVMLANNEVGALQPAAAAAAIAARAGARFLCDAIQAVGKIAVTARAIGADYLPIAAHKLNGPKGAGCLCVRHGAPCVPMIAGGGQEGGLRSGTENVPGLAGFGEACRLARERTGEQERIAARRDALQERLVSGGGAQVLAAHAERLPNTIGCILDGVDAEALVVRLSRRGVFISAGSACHAGKTKGSHVLAAMGVPEPRRASFVRVSLGAGTTDEEADRAAAVIVEEAARIRRKR